MKTPVSKRATLYASSFLLLSQALDASVMATKARRTRDQIYGVMESTPQL